MRMLGYVPFLGFALLSCDPVAHSTVTLRPYPAPAPSDSSGAAVLAIVAALAPRFGYAEEVPTPGRESGCTRTYSYRGPEISPQACALVGADDGSARVSFWIMGARHLPAPAQAFRDALADSLRTAGQVSVDR